MSQSNILPPKPTRHLARLTLIAFLFTFIASRTLVILIMARRMPDLFLHMGGTHVHHLNYGIFLLAAVAGILLFARLNDKQRSVCALAYGFAMALTFDEFGMWLHLGGSYWQRASFDAVIVLLGVFGIMAFLPRWQRIRAHHYIVAGALLASIASFYLLLFKSLKHANDKLMPRLIELEQEGPK
jgi:glucose dehydrogenase